MFGRYIDVTIVTARSSYALSTNRMLRCYSVTADKYKKNLNKLALVCGYLEVTVKFRQCYTDVTKVTVHSQYANFTNQMLQCYSVKKYVNYHKLFCCTLKVYCSLHRCYNSYSAFLYALSTNRMLRCYSVIAHKCTKNVN